MPAAFWSKIVCPMSAGNPPSTTASVLCGGREPIATSVSFS